MVGGGGGPARIARLTASSAPAAPPPPWTATIPRRGVGPGIAWARRPQPVSRKTTVSASAVRRSMGRFLGPLLVLGAATVLSYHRRPLVACPMNHSCLSISVVNHLPADGAARRARPGRRAPEGPRPRTRTAAGGWRSPAR